MTTQFISKLLKSKEALAAVDIRTWPPVLDTGEWVTRVQFASVQNKHSFNFKLYLKRRSAKEEAPATVQTLQSWHSGLPGLQRLHNRDASRSKGEYLFTRLTTSCLTCNTQKGNKIFIGSGWWDVGSGVSWRTSDYFLLLLGMKEPSSCHYVIQLEPWAFTETIKHCVALLSLDKDMIYSSPRSLSLDCIDITAHWRSLLIWQTCKHIVLWVIVVLIIKLWKAVSYWLAS